MTNTILVREKHPGVLEKINREKEKNKRKIEKKRQKGER